MSDQPRHFSTSDGNQGIPFVSRKDADVERVDEAVQRAFGDFPIFTDVRRLDGIIYVAMRVRVDELVMCCDGSVVPKGSESPDAVVDLVLIDNEPDANLAHDFSYALVFDDGHVRWLFAEWPPCEKLHMKLRQYTDCGGH